MATDTLVPAARLVGAVAIIDEHESADIRRHPLDARGDPIRVADDAPLETSTEATLGAVPSM